MRNIAATGLMLLFLPCLALGGVVFEVEEKDHSNESTADPDDPRRKIVIPTPPDKIKVTIRWSWTEYEDVEIWNLRSRTTGTWRTIYNGTDESTEVDDIRPGVAYDVRIRGKSEGDGWSAWSEIWTLQCDLPRMHDELPTCEISPVK